MLPISAFPDRMSYAWEPSAYSYSPNLGGVDLAALDNLDENGLEEVLGERVLEATLAGLIVRPFCAEAKMLEYLRGSWGCGRRRQ